MVQKLTAKNGGKDTQFIVNTVLTTAVAIVTIMVILILYIDQQSREDIRLMIRRSDEQEQKFKTECQQIINKVHDHDNALHAYRTR